MFVVKVYYKIVNFHPELSIVHTSLTWVSKDAFGLGLIQLFANSKEKTNDKLNLNFKRVISWDEFVKLVLFSSHNKETIKGNWTHAKALGKISLPFFS